MASAPPLLPVRVAETPRRGEPVTVLLRTGHMLKVSHGFDEDAFARVVVLGEEGMRPIPTRHSLEKIRQVRRSAKHKVFVVNAVRALERVAPGGNLREIGFVVVLGGSALDFEIPDLIAEAVAGSGIVCGTGNVRGSQGPRNAVATGLVAEHAAGPR